MESMPRIEKSATPEKNEGELYFNALEKKRDTLLSFHAMNYFREGKKAEEMSEEEVEQYKTLKEDWQLKKEASLIIWDNLPKDKQEELAAMGSRLYDVQSQLTLLGKDVSGISVPKPEVVPQPETGSVEIPARDMTLEEIEGKIAFAKGQTLGLKGESVEYWEAQKTQLIERQEAEVNPDRKVPDGFSLRAKDSFATTQEEIWKTGENAKKGGFWSWFSERGLGIWTFGLRDIYQAERFRNKTKEVANDVEALENLIQQERNLSPKEAEKEAREIVEELKKNNLDISAPEFYQANKDITERKRKENDQEIEYIIKSTVSELAEKLTKYRGESGQDVLTLENKLAFEADLRGELNRIRDGATRKEFINYAKLMRRNLDKDWWLRYIWAPNEAMWAWADLIFGVTKLGY